VDLIKLLSAKGKKLKPLNGIKIGVLSTKHHKYVKISAFRVVLP
jgi:hypothetical protein